MRQKKDALSARLNVYDRYLFADDFDGVVQTDLDDG